MICTDVKLTTQKNRMKRVYLTGACNDAETDELKAQFCEKLQGELEHISRRKSVVYDPKSLESLVEADGVVLFERVDMSAYADIEKELEYCKRYGVPVIGYVVVE